MLTMQGRRLSSSALMSDSMRQVYAHMILIIFYILTTQHGPVHSSTCHGWYT